MKEEKFVHSTNTSWTSTKPLYARVYSHSGDAYVNEAAKMPALREFTFWGQKEKSSIK